MSTKRCAMCKTSKPHSEFYFSSRTGLTAYCKDCVKTRYNTEHRAKYPVKKTESRRISVNEASRRAYIKHKEKWLARAKARYAIKKGIIIKPEKCEVCELKKPLQGHHEDYSKPLEVIFLCYSCHVEADRELENRNPPLPIREVK